MTADPQDPKPGESPGLEPGGGVRPGDTPPSSSGESESTPPTPAPKDRQTPVALAVIIGIVVLIGILFLVWAFVVADTL